MKNWVIVFSILDPGCMGLESEYINIQGESPKTALEKYLGRKVKRVFGEDDRYSDIILHAGFYNKSDNAIKGRLSAYCYKFV